MPYPLALAVAEVESHFNMEAVGAAGEVGIMQLNPGPDGAYHAELEAATGLDPTTPSGNIAAGCYLLGKYMADYKDPHKAAMAYNMGVAGAKTPGRRGHINRLLRRCGGGHGAVGGDRERMEWNLNRTDTRAAAARRARIHRWSVPGRARVTHPAHGSVVVPHCSNWRRS